jgi:hypothetical protein
VHQDYRDFAAADYITERGIELEGGDIVYNFRASGDSGFCYGGFAGVNRDWNTNLIAQAEQYRENAGNFFIGGYCGSAGARGFAADVDYVRTGFFQFESVIHGG